VGEPIGESSGGGFGVRLAPGEGASEQSSRRFPEPAVRGATDLDVTTGTRFEDQFGEYPIALAAVEDPEAAPLLPGERVVAARGSDSSFRPDGAPIGISSSNPEANGNDVAARIPWRSDHRLS
jgi:hypothetical protein